MAQPKYTPHFAFLPKNGGPTGRQFKTKFELKQWSYWAHQPTNQRRQALRGTIGSKSCDPNPPLSAVGGAQRGVEGHNFSTQWSHCFGFGTSRSPFLVLGGAQRRVGGHNFSTQWNQWMRSFGFGPSRSPFLVVRIYPLSEFSPLSYITY